MTAFEMFALAQENGHVEVKLAQGGLPKSLWETYSAFANTEGGVIILGVKEQASKGWQWEGVRDPERLVKDFWDTVNNRNKVSLNLLSDKDVSVVEYEGRKFICIQVPRAERANRPIYLGNDLLGGSFRRNGEGDYRCSSEEVKAMLRDADAMSQDLVLVKWGTIDVLNLESIKRYRMRMQLGRPGHVWQALDDVLFLQRVGALGYDEHGVLRPTRAGLLMFGNEYDIVREFPQYFLDYQEKFDVDTRWTDRVYSSSGDWSGNVFDFFYLAYNRIAQTIKLPFQMEGIYRKDDTPVHKAIREVLANALVNADYFLPRGVVIIREVNALILSNPGSFRIPVNVAKSGGISDPRNATILKMFNLIDVGERTGSGIPLIASVCEEMAWPMVQISDEVNPNRTQIHLSMLSSVNLGDNGVNLGDNGVNLGGNGVSLGDNGASLGEKTLVPKRLPKAELESLICSLCTNEALSCAEIAGKLTRSVETIRPILNALVKARRLKLLYPTARNHPSQKYQA